MTKSEIAHVRKRVAEAVPVPLSMLIVRKVKDRKVILEAGCQMIEARAGWCCTRVPWGPGVSLDDVIRSLTASLRHDMEKMHGRGA